MGIPYYFFTIYKKYSNVNNNLMITEDDLKKLNIKYLFLDYNSMIHPCAQDTLKIANENENNNIDDLEDFIISKCLVYTNYVIDTINPECVFIMIDGVAPRAKINQQRERRYKSQLIKKLSGSNKWDSNKITPGTTFMKRLSDKLNIVINKTSRKIIISDSNEPGEGEHKMMKIISNLKLLDREKIFIYGLDADLIMLSLLNKWRDNIILLRDNTFNEKLTDFQKVFTYLDVCKLKNCIGEEMQSQCNNYYNSTQKNNFNLQKGNLHKTKQFNLDNNNLIYDYIFLCTLLGNDFLEHIPSLIIKENGLNIILKCYCKCLIENYKTENYLTNSQSYINIVFLKNLFYKLSNYEEYFFKNVWSIYKNKNNQIYKDTFSLEQNENLIIYTNDFIKYNFKDYKRRHYNYYGISNNDIDECCKNFLDGLHWVWGYYNCHSHNNWDWYYKYHGSPFIMDLYKYLDKHYTKFNCTFTSSSPLQPIQQLIMVLPKDSLLEILKEIDVNIFMKIKRLVIDQKEYFPDKLVLDMINKEYLWQSKIFLKTIDINIVNYLLL